jgi:hypothetical protein
MSTQTPKVLSALLAQMPDNTVGDISAQDMRDAVVSLYPSRGALELVSTPIATTFTASGVYTKVAAATLIDGGVCTSCVEMPADGELRFLKPVDQVLLVNATVAVLPAGNNKQYSFTFAKNGTPIDSLHVSQFFGNLAGRPVGVFLSGLLAITGNDVISLVVRNDTDTTAITASILSLSGIGFIK